MTLSFLSPLYNAVSWLMAQIHTGLSTFLPSTSGEAWFLTIVVLVVGMRLILVPLFVKQMHAMRKMSALTPQLQELRKKYKGDKQTLNEETMKLYKEAGVNPLGGCLPLLAQMPVFFALFTVLREIAGWHSGLALPYGFSEVTVKSAQNANILGAHISDKVLFTHGMYVPLHAKIVILCFVAVSVTTTFLTVRQSTKRGMTPQMTPDNPMAASQKYMAYIVPFFALSGLYWAFGLVLYWVTTNVWTLGQQYVLFKRYPPTAPADAAAGTGSPAVSTSPATAAGLVSRSNMPAPRSAADARKRPTQAKPAAKQAPAKQSAAKQSAVSQLTPKQIAAREAAAAEAAKRKAAYQAAARDEPLPAAANSATEAKPAVAGNSATAGEPAAAGKPVVEAKPAPAAESAGAGKPATAARKPAAAARKPATAGKPAPAARSAQATKPAAAGKPAAAAKPPAAKSAPAKSAGSSSQRQGKKTASSAATSGTAQGRTAGQPAPETNGSGPVSGILRRFGKGRAETVEEPEQAEVKLVRQQRVRQSRSKRSGKR